MSTGMVINNSASGVIVRNNQGTSTTGQAPAFAFNVPPSVPLNMGSLVTLFESADPQSAPPVDKGEGDIYLDDGTNTQSGTLGWRQYNDGAWQDLGLQEVGDIAVDGGTF